MRIQKFFIVILLFLADSFIPGRVCAAETVERGGLYDITLALHDSEPSQSAPLVILSLGSNDLLLYTLLLEKEEDGRLFLSLLSVTGLDRRPFPCDSLPKTLSLPIGIHLDTEADVLSVSSPGRDTVLFTNLHFPLYRFSLFPPDVSAGSWVLDRWTVIRRDKRKAAGLETYLLIALIAFDVAVVLLVYLRRRRGRETEKSSKEASIKNLHAGSAASGRLARSSVQLFGEFCVTDAQGNDISDRFSPILRELLALLIVHSVRNGISSAELRTILWFDKSEKSAANNRSVYFSKLRSLMKEVGQFQIAGGYGHWTLAVEGIDIDYFTYCSILGQKELAPSDLLRLEQIVSAGPFLNGFDEPWVDDFKAEVSDFTISVFTSYLEKLDAKDDREKILRICDLISRFDSLSEPVLVMRCKIARSDGKHMRARQIYDRYAKEYQQLYGEPFKYSLDEILAGDLAAISHFS